MMGRGCTETKVALEAFQQSIFRPSHHDFGMHLSLRAQCGMVPRAAAILVARQIRGMLPRWTEDKFNASTMDSHIDKS